jgi:hypothetical protein
MICLLVNFSSSSKVKVTCSSVIPLIKKIRLSLHINENKEGGHVAYYINFVEPGESDDADGITLIDMEG